MICLGGTTASGRERKLYGDWDYGEGGRKETACVYRQEGRGGEGMVCLKE